MFKVPSVSCRMLCEQLNNKIRGYQLRGLCEDSLCSANCIRKQKYKSLENQKEWNNNSNNSNEQPAKQVSNKSPEK